MQSSFSSIVNFKTNKQFFRDNLRFLDNTNLCRNFKIKYEILILSNDNCLPE